MRNLPILTFKTDPAALAMAFKKPFRAEPVRPGDRYRGKLKRQSQRDLGKTLALCAIVSLLVFAGGMLATNPDLRERFTPRLPTLLMSGEERERVEASVYYSGCNEARAAGAAPISAGSPGYRTEMDGDGDGVACEPYFGH